MPEQLRTRQRRHVVGHSEGEPMRDHNPSRRVPEPPVTAPTDRAGPPQAATPLDGHDLGPPALDDVPVSSRGREAGQPLVIEPASTHASTRL